MKKLLIILTIFTFMCPLFSCEKTIDEEKVVWDMGFNSNFEFYVKKGIRPENNLYDGIYSEYIKTNNNEYSNDILKYYNYAKRKCYQYEIVLNI